MVNRLNEWVDARFRRVRVFADPTQEEMERPQLWRLWRSAAGRVAAPSRRRVDARLPCSPPVKSMSPTSVIGSTTSRPYGDAGRRRCPGAEVLPAHPGQAAKSPARRRTRVGWFIDQRDWAASRVGSGSSIAERILRETSGPGAPWTIALSTDDRYRDPTGPHEAALTARLAETHHWAVAVLGNP